jgi:hypothetical protein
MLPPNLAKYAALADEVREIVEVFTVPLALLWLEADQRNVRQIENGSGILVKFGSAHIVLTAGHVAMAARRADAVHIGIQSGKHRWIPGLTIGSVYVPGTFVDLGYMIIEPADASRPPTASKLYANPQRRIAVLTAPELAAKRCHAFVAGYPFAIMDTQPAAQGVRLLVWHTAITGSDEEVCDVTTSPHSIGLVVPESQYASFPAPVVDVELPPLGGVSGGGMWIVERDHEGGAFGKTATLVGLHIGTGYSEGRRLAREVMIGHLLRLIAHEQPTIAKDIYGAFPRLRDDEWDVPI